MAGAHVGRLNVYSTGLYENDKLLWRLFGDQTDTWKEAHVPVSIIQPQYQVNLSPHLKGEKTMRLRALKSIQLFRQRLSHKSVKAYTTIPIGIMGRKSLGLIELGSRCLPTRKEKA